ncbi:cation diffusion facilitator family transporter [Labedella endophytica]|uniref:Cation transporter n=1 Tax=Labedella endophytica TaxID=1523160 RepID=A0A3S0Y168_9MICO|nr:cation transporter [Labedella endophytica]RUR01852.1 cation transporter [Labedella endophytica]
MSADRRRFGHTELPARQEDALRAAIRIEWATLVFLAVTIALVYLVLGNSQAMKAAWIEDLLSLAPPIAFLVAARIVQRAPNRERPYGYHRSVGVGHLVAGVALFAMGAYLVIDSISGLISGEHPPIGSVELFGEVIWLGWLMMGVMALTIPLPIYFGRRKMALARELHDKVLFADADMNKADWQTAVGSIVGVAGIGVGLWWADSAAALFIASSIVWDGTKNLRGAVRDLMDSRARTFDDGEPLPVEDRIIDTLRARRWIADVGVRLRDQGHVLHAEVFVVPRRNRLTLDDLIEARDECIALDWKIADAVIVPVDELPEEVGGAPRDRQSERNR